jgi:hypothetical protein
MTPEKQRIAIAEACGWGLNYDWERPGIGEWWEKTGEQPRRSNDLPDYLNDLNAMHDAEDTLFGSVYDRYYNEIAKLIDPYDSDTARFADFAVINSTAAQRAEAFLRTIGKWEESE